MSENQLMRKLNYYFWLLSLSATAMGIFLMLCVPDIAIDETIRMQIQTAAIISLLGFTPLGLWLYSKKVTSATLPDDIKQRTWLITKWFTVRFVLVGTAMYLNMVIYAVTKEHSLLYGIGIAFLFLFFLCKPNRKEITQLLSQNNL